MLAGIMQQDLILSHCLTNELHQLIFSDAALSIVAVSAGLPVFDACPIS